jgi:hypothetical protein
MPRKADDPSDDPPSLSIEDTIAARVRVRKDDLQPYDLFDGKRAQRKKRTDLRKLNEWIKAQRRAEVAQRASAPDSEPTREHYVLFMPLGRLRALIASALRKLGGK